MEAELLTRMTHETRISELQELFRPIAINGEIVDVLIMNVSFVFCGRLAQLLELKTIVCCGTLTFSSVYNNKITPPPSSMKSYCTFRSIL